MMTIKLDWTTGGLRMGVYPHEWLSDLAIIPAWECFICGIMVGLIIGWIITLRK